MAARLHVCVVNVSPYVFGAEKSMASLMSLLAPYPVRFSSITGGGSAEDLFQQSGAAETRQCRFQRLSTSRNPVELLHQFFHWRDACSQLRGMLEEMRPDIVHANGIQAMVHLLGRPRMKARIVWHVRDRIRGRWIERLCAKASDAIVVPAQGMLAELKEFEGKCRCCLNPLGSDFVDKAHALSDADGAQARSSIRIGFFGQLIPRKGCDVLLKALPAVFERLPHIEVDLYGEDPFDPSSSYVREIRRTVENLRNEGKKVFLKGYISDVQQAYRDVQIVVIPSLDEPFGRVAYEAMSFGKTVIASRTGGLAESISDRKNGLLVEPGDHESLSTAIIEVAENRELRMRWAHSGRESALRYHALVQQSVEEVFELYQQLTKGRQCYASIDHARHSAVGVFSHGDRGECSGEDGSGGFIASARGRQGDDEISC